MGHFRRLSKEAKAFDDSMSALSSGVSGAGSNNKTKPIVWASRRMRITKQRLGVAKQKLTVESVGARCVCAVRESIQGVNTTARIDSGNRCDLCSVK